MRSVMLIMCFLIASSAHASFDDYPSSPKGLINLKHWVGKYQITNCIRCDEGVLPNQVKLRNFATFGIAANQFPVDKLPACALTDTNVFVTFDFTSDDKVAHSYRETSLGLCDWDISGKWTKFLTIAPEIFHFQETTGANDQITIRIEKINSNQFKIYRRVLDSHPESGIPSDFTEIAEAQKMP